MSFDLLRYVVIIISLNLTSWLHFLNNDVRYLFILWCNLMWIIIWSRDTLLTILIIFRRCISQDNLSVAMDRNNLSVSILNLLRIRDVIIYNLMTLHSYHNTCGNIWKITGQFTQVKCSASKVCQWIFSNSFLSIDIQHIYTTGPIYYNRNKAISPTIMANY